MPLNGKFEEFLWQIQTAKSVIDLKAIMRKMTAESGLANIAYHALKIPIRHDPAPILILTYEDDWVRRYVERDYFALDPTVRAGSKGFLPLDWLDVDRSSVEVQRFFREADAYGVGRQGVTLPVRGPAGERALFTVTSNLADADWKSRRLLYMRDFQLLGHFIHDRAVDLSGYRIEGPALSGREAQCLERTASGRHVKQIASELALSISAVQLYLRSARHKLGCASVAEAVVKATRRELL